MHAAIIGFAGGVLTVVTSFFVETFWPLGDWRWGVSAAVCLALMIAVWLHKERHRLFVRKVAAGPAMEDASRGIADWHEFDILPLKHIACLWHDLPPGEASMQKPIVQEELARLSLAVQQGKLEHWNGAAYHGLLMLLSKAGPSPNDQFTRDALIRYAESAGRKLPAFLREKTK